MPHYEQLNIQKESQRRLSSASVLGLGPLLSLGPGPAHRPPKRPKGIIGGPGPASIIGPRPKTYWTRSKHSLDLDQKHLGPGPLMYSRPSPAHCPSGHHCGTIISVPMGALFHQPKAHASWARWSIDLGQVGHRFGPGGSQIWARWDYECTTWPTVLLTGALRARFNGRGGWPKNPPGPKQAPSAFSLLLPPIQPYYTERRFDGLAVSKMAFLAKNIAANPQNHQYVHSRWIGGKKGLRRNLGDRRDMDQVHKYTIE